PEGVLLGFPARRDRALEKADPARHLPLPGDWLGDGSGRRRECEQRPRVLPLQGPHLHHPRPRRHHQSGHRQRQLRSTPRSHHPHGCHRRDRQTPRMAQALRASRDALPPRNLTRLFSLQQLLLETRFPPCYSVSSVVPVLISSEFNLLFIPSKSSFDMDITCPQTSCREVRRREKPYPASCNFPA